MVSMPALKKRAFPVVRAFDRALIFIGRINARLNKLLGTIEDCDDLLAVGRFALIGGCC